jgi:hypothetical protein
MDVGVADAIEVGENRHAGLVLNTLDQALAAARHDHVDQPGCTQHGAHGGAVLRGHQLHRLGRDAGSAKAFGKGGGDGAVGMDRLAPAAQESGIAAHQAQRCGIGGDVGTAFVDDSDQADGNPAAHQLKAAGCRAAIDFLPHGIGQAGYRFDRLGDSFQPLVIEPQPVEHGTRQAVGLAGGNVLRIGGQDVGGVGAQGSSGRH